MGSKLLNNKRIPIIYLGIIIVIAFLVEIGFSIESKVADLFLYLVVGILAILSIRSVSFQTLEGRGLALISFILSICLFILNGDLFLSFILITTLVVFLLWLTSKEGNKSLRTISFLFGLLTIGVNVLFMFVNWFILPGSTEDIERIVSPNKQFVLVSKATDLNIVVDVQKKFYFVKWERRLYIGEASESPPKMKWIGKYEVLVNNRKINIFIDS